MGLSNIRVTTKVAVNALLGDTPTLQEYGSAIMYNLGTKEVKAAVNFGIIYKQLEKGFVIWCLKNYSDIFCNFIHPYFSKW